MDGRKIIREHENPLDNILIDFASYIGKPLSKFPFFTPNVFTTISLLVTFVGVYLIYKKKYRIGAVLVFIGYFFDCVDGNFARKYNMATDFGDWYDHISDLVKYILVIAVILISKFKTKTKVLFIIIIVISQILHAIHLGCQQIFYNDNSVLSKLTGLCIKKENITYTRFFGSGTMQLATTLFVFNIKFINRIL